MSTTFSIRYCAMAHNLMEKNIVYLVGKYGRHKSKSNEK